MSQRRCFRVAKKVEPAPVSAAPDAGHGALCPLPYAGLSSAPGPWSRAASSARVAAGPGHPGKWSKARARAARVRVCVCPERPRDRGAPRIARCSLPCRTVFGQRSSFLTPRPPPLSPCRDRGALRIARSRFGDLRMQHCGGHRRPREPPSGAEITPGEKKITP